MSFENLINLQTLCRKKNIPFVSFRLPENEHITTFIQYKNAPEKITDFTDFDTKRGFVIAPFDTEKKNILLLNPDYVFVDNEIDNSIVEELFFGTGDSRFRGNDNKTTSKTEFILQVENAIKSFNADFQKVVLSKIKVVKKPKRFSESEFFLHLCKKYPSAFVYLLNTAESGCWAGASPEMLFCTDNQTVRIAAIAGTQIATEKALNEYRWTTKDIEEQTIVSDFVEQTLKNAKVEKFEKTAVFNCQAGNLIHLKTAFSFSAKQLKYRGKFLSILHPTPAVCGYGKRAAQDFIAANEKHLRKYYSGFLGILNFDNRTDLFVNLRCAQILENRIILYAGAGITAQSVPENEWLETENKLQTLLNAVIPANAGIPC